MSSWRRFSPLLARRPGTRFLDKATDAGWTPTQLDDLVGYYKATDVLTSGSDITEVTNLGTAYADLDTASSPPSLVTSSINGKPAIYCDGTEYIQEGGSVSRSWGAASDTMSCFLIARAIAGGSNEMFMSMSTLIDIRFTGSGNFMEFAIASQTGGVDNSDTSDSASLVTSPNRVWCAGFVKPAAAPTNWTATLYFNGLTMGTITSSSSLDTQQITLGARPNGALPADCEIFELIVTSDTLTSDEVARLQGYANKQYGALAP